MGTGVWATPGSSVEVGGGVEVGLGVLAGISAGERVAVATCEGAGVYVEEVGVAAGAVWTLAVCGVAGIFASVAAWVFGVGGMFALAVSREVAAAGVDASG